ncbi:nuclear transport factor 2 family protein [Methylobacterium oxalidis]|uniref:nuclear transport factor 2 family protein n=1 Tax=Methylobacterium oxalidis TaxID=944322 RepID=UPI00331531D5
MSNRIGFSHGRRRCLVAGTLLSGSPFSLFPVFAGTVPTPDRGPDLSNGPEADRSATRVFCELLDRVARGWNTGDAALAASAFTEDAVYVEPPDRQRYVGRDALFRFFGGGSPKPKRMSMIWHGAAFDAAGRSGFGEYTFALPDDGFQVHGVAAIGVRAALIATWREYQTPSALAFPAFAGDSLPRR